MTTFVVHSDISKSALPVPIRITRPSGVNRNLGYLDHDPSDLIVFDTQQEIPEDVDR